VSLIAITQKEMGDLVREKRFGAWALTFLAFWMLFLFFYLGSLEQSRFSGGGGDSLQNLVEPAFYFYAFGFAVLTLFILTDGITKERESGMLPLVAAKPIVRWHLVLAKLFTGLAVYAAAYLVTLAPALVLVAAIGFPALQMLTLLFVGPFLVMYVFLVGLGLLLGVVSSSSKVAIGTASGLILPLFFLMREGPLTLLYRRYPNLQEFSSYTPFEAAHTATQVAMFGGQMPWGPIALTVGLGALFIGLAFWLFSRQEVAA